MPIDWNKGLSKETDERVKRQSDALKLRWKNTTHSCIGRICSEKTRELHRLHAIERLKLKGHPNKGKKLSEATKQKIRESVKKNWRGGSKKGVKKPNVSETRKRLFKEGILIPLCGEKNPMYGKPINEMQARGLKKGHGWNKGRKGLYRASEELKKKLSEMGIGEKNNNWKGGKLLRTARAYLKRRQLGYEVLNTQFDGSVGHHINREQVIYIPKEVHERYRHRLNKPESMELINRIAIYFLSPAIIPIPKEIG